MHRNVPAPGDLARQQFGLIESTLPMPAPMKGHRYDAIKALFAGNDSRQKIPERPGQGLNSLVLQKVNQTAECALVGTVRIDSVEARQTKAAEGATAIFIQRT
jgi:hypothetical protein